MKHLKVLVKCNGWWNFTCVSTISLNFEIYFLSSDHGKLFSMLFQAIIYVFSFRKCKNDCKILKIILVKDFCPLKPEIAWFSIGFRLNYFTQRLHYAGEIWKCSFMSTVKSTVHTNPSRKRSVSKTLFKPEEFENAAFSFSCGRKTFWKRSFS